MQIKGFLATALLCEAVVASYTIKMYNKAGCKNKSLTSVYSCTNQAAQDCCFKTGTIFQSAKFTENGSSGTANTDEMKIYQAVGTDHCGMPIDQQKEKACASSSSKDVSGASVWVVLDMMQGSVGSKRGEGTVRHVEPDRYFVERAGVTYTMDLRSPKGRELEMMAREEDKIAHVLALDKREVNPGDLE